MNVPVRAHGPDSGAITATFTGFGWARSMRHGITDALASVAAPTAPCLIKVRRVVISSSVVVVVPLHCRALMRRIRLHSKIGAADARVRHQRLVRALHRDMAG